MKACNLVIGAALVVSTALITTQVVSQDTKPAPPKPGAAQPPAMSPEEAAMMEKWMEFATPGENHKLLDAKAGKWNGEVTHWMAPGAPAESMTCTANIEWIFDGRYLMEEVEGSFNGETFLGKSCAGYDNMKKKFFWAWIDNMGTGIMHAEGAYNASTKTFTYTYDHPDIMAGKYNKGRSVEKVIDKDHFVTEMYGPGPDGKEFKMMEIKYSRAK